MAAADSSKTATVAEAESATVAEETVELDGTPFTVYYGQLQHQQNMLQDLVREVIVLCVMTSASHRTPHIELRR